MITAYHGPQILDPVVVNKNELTTEKPSIPRVKIGQI